MRHFQGSDIYIWRTDVANQRFERLTENENINKKNFTKSLEFYFNLL